MTLTLQENNLIIDNQLLLIENQLYRLNEKFTNFEGSAAEIDIERGKKKSDNLIIRFLQMLKNFLVNVVRLILEIVDYLIVALLKIVSKIKSKAIKKIISPATSITVLDKVISSYIVAMEHCKTNAKNGRDVDIIEPSWMILSTTDSHQSRIDGLEYLNKLTILSKKIKKYVSDNKNDIKKIESELKSNTNLDPEELKRKKELFKIAKSSINALGHDAAIIIRRATENACREIFIGTKYDVKDVTEDLNKVDFNDKK